MVIWRLALMSAPDEIFDGMDKPLTKEEWLELMADPEIFTESRMDVLRSFIRYGGEATSVQLEEAYGQSYNYYKVNFENLGKDICSLKGLPNGGKNSQWWYVLAKGRYASPGERGEYFWIIRDELRAAFFDYTGSVESQLDDGDSDLGIFTGAVDGKARQYISVRYERDPRNRALAIKEHGCKCQVCGFDFEKEYGSLGKDFIEVHHIEFLKDTGEKKIDPKTDLACLCSNCHRMIHRSKEHLTPDDLEKLWNSIHGKS